ncbi:MAG: peptidase E [Candidatus Peribacteria bacterium]|nr:peptidase E [Candidatus Peribacteria bacterium]
MDLRQETQISLKEKLPQYDAVFVSGGNGFWLLECMKKSGFTALIREFLKKGIYISTSAGSCVCAPNIEYTKDADDPSVSQLTADEYDGLNFCNLAIDPHFNSKESEELLPRIQYFKENDIGFPCIDLTDQQAIVGNLQEGIRIIS